METPVSPPSRIKKILRGLLFGLAALITLLALFAAEERWRGRRAWHDYKTAMEAKGERFDAARLIPPQVPDDQNFAACQYLRDTFASKLLASGWTNLDSYLPRIKKQPRHPGWSFGLAEDLTNWAAAFQGGNAPATTNASQAAAVILDHLKACEPALAELRAACSRPYCRFDIPYVDLTGTNEAELKAAGEATTRQYERLKGLFSFLALHAESELAAAQSDAALADVAIMFRLDDGLKDQPLVVSQSVRDVITTAVLLRPIAEGLAEHRWSEPQLRALQAGLARIDLPTGMVRGLYGERDLLINPFFSSPMMKWMSLFGWDRLEQLHLNQAYQETVLPRIDLAHRQINPSVAHSCDTILERYAESGSFFQHNFFAGRMLGALCHTAEQAAPTQTDADLVMVACALERCRLAQGTYPENLDALAPTFIDKLPHDIINGQPLHYRRTANGKFILYSVGWNMKDDGGTMVVNKSGSPNRKQGDWVLEYPD